MPNTVVIWAWYVAFVLIHFGRLLIKAVIKAAATARAVSLRTVAALAACVLD